MTWEYDVGPAPPDPDDPLSRFHYERLQLGEMWVQACRDCGLLSFPPRPICRRCTSFRIGPRRLSGAATITFVGDEHFGDDPFAARPAPFRQGVVQVVEQDTLHIRTKILCDASSVIECGMPVEADGEETTDGSMRLVFRLATERDDRRAPRNLPTLQ